MSPPNVEASISVGLEQGATTGGSSSCRSIPAVAPVMAGNDDVVVATTTSTSPTSTTSADAPLPLPAPSPPPFPVVDLSPLLRRDSDPQLASPEALMASRAIAESLVATGCVLVHDPRVSERDSERFLDLLERYFEQEDEAKRRDARPELHYQIGATPEGIERPSMLREGSSSASRARALVAKIELREKEEKEEEKESEADVEKKSSSSSLPTWPRGADPKWRFFWRVGPRPSQTRFPELNSPQVVPEAFASEWQATLDGWGHKMLECLDAVSRGIARGLGMPSADAISSMLVEGPHLLAPTGSDLEKHATPGTVLAGCHADLNLLTAHGRGRLPGLFVWTRSGERVAVRVPPGCLLLQAGMQLEYLTGGEIEAGMHEVLVTEEAVERVKKGKEKKNDGDTNRVSSWRVSSTVFGHVRSDETLRPLLPFDSRCGRRSRNKDDDAEGDEKYPPILAGDFVSRELEAIALKRE